MESEEKWMDKAIELAQKEGLGSTKTFEVKNRGKCLIKLIFRKGKMKTYAFY